MKNSQALISGLLAAFGSSFGKLSGIALFDYQLLAYFVQSLCFAVMLFLNTTSLTYYVKAMQLSSSYTATVLSSATNYLLSGLLGVFIFAETTGSLWWCGISIVLLGMILILNSKEEFKSD